MIAEGDLAARPKTPNVPGLDLPSLDIVSTAKAFGCASVLAKKKQVGLIWGGAAICVFRLQGALC